MSLAPHRTQMSGGRFLDRRFLLGSAGVLLLAGCWELVSRREVLPSSDFPPITVVLSTLVTLLQQPETWESIGQTAFSWVMGLIIGSVVGVSLGMAIGASRWFAKLTRVTIEVLKPIPPVVFIPPIVLILGSTQTMKIVLVTYAVVWPMLMESASGMHNVDVVVRNMAAIFRVGRADRARSIYLPSSWPFIVTGLRMAAVYALFASIVAELVGGAPGLGNTIVVAQTSNDAPTMYALILVTAGFGLLLASGLGFIERRTLDWHTSRDLS